MKIEHLVRDRINGCPFGQQCESCNLYVPLYNTQDDGSITQKWNCSINNAATLIDELKNRTTGVQHAVEQVRNEAAKPRIVPLGQLLENKSQ